MPSSYKTLLNEALRLKVLKELRLLDTPPDRRLDRITETARDIFGTPMALVTLIDEHRQWFKSKQGIDGTETPREHAFCAHTIQHPEPLIILDALTDPRFAANPYVIGDPHVRFYAGAPLITREGAAIGALCIVGTEPREEFRDQELRVLNELADLAMHEIETKKRDDGGEQNEK